MHADASVVSIVDWEGVGKRRMDKDLQDTVPSDEDEREGEDGEPRENEENDGEV